jgi:hypothetical protein
MTIALARLAHPGPRAADRRQAAPATLRPLAGRLAAGRPVLDEVARLFADAGCKGGVLWLDGVICDPMRFVLPAYATDDRHAARRPGPNRPLHCLGRLARRSAVPALPRPMVRCIRHGDGPPAPLRLDHRR